MKKKWNDDEWIRLAGELMERSSKTPRISSADVKLMFDLHNDRVPEYFRKMEYTKSCGSCVRRVHNRIQSKVNENADK